MIALHSTRLRALLLPLLCAFAVLLVGQSVRAASPAADVQTSWRLLDYIAVDYPAAVSAGRVVNAAEYQEMTEFSASALAKYRSRNRRLVAAQAAWLPAMLKTLPRLLMTTPRRRSIILR